MRLTTEFSDIPQGTAGKVVAKVAFEPGGFDVLVAWDEPATNFRPE